MMRKAIRGHLENNPDLERLLPHIRGNIGFVFTKEELVTIRDDLLANKVRAPAKSGALAPLAVIVPAQNTGLGPEKTSFFQALNIPTKIQKGTIEIVNDVNLIKEGDKVGMSEATLLNMLNISPFTYGLVIRHVYDSGTIFDPAILDITDDDLRARFGPALHRQRLEEVHGPGRRHRHHLQGGREDEGVPRRSEQVRRRRCCRRPGCCCRSCGRQEGREEGGVRGGG